MTRTPLVTRTLLVVVVALAAATVPMRQVAACSCVGFATPEEAIAAHDVTFIGTVVDTADGGGDEFGRTVRYAFDVESASVPTDALIVVQAVDDGGGASCGFAFGMGERWLVSAYRQGAELETSLCSNNQLAADLPPDQLASLGELLPNIPPPPPEPAPGTSGSDLSIPAAIGVVGLGLAGLLAVSVLAFRQRRDRPA